METVEASMKASMKASVQASVKDSMEDMEASMEKKNPDASTESFAKASMEVGSTKASTEASMEVVEDAAEVTSMEASTEASTSTKASTKASTEVLPRKLPRIRKLPRKNSHGFLCFFFFGSNRQLPRKVGSSAASTNSWKLHPRIFTFHFHRSFRSFHGLSAASTTGPSDISLLCTAVSPVEFNTFSTTWLTNTVYETKGVSPYNGWLLRFIRLGLGLGLGVGYVQFQRVCQPHAGSFHRSFRGSSFLSRKPSRKIPRGFFLKAFVEEN